MKTRVDGTGSREDGRKSYRWTEVVQMDMSRVDSCDLQVAASSRRTFNFAKSACLQKDDSGCVTPVPA